MTDEKRVQITNKATGESYLSEPVPVRKAPAQEAPPADVGEKHKADFDRSSRLEVLGTLKNGDSASHSSENRQRDGKGKKKEIESLADFIEAVYNLKGRKPADLRGKHERAVFENPKLQERRQELLKLAQADVLLAVPRQLVLARRQTRSYPGVQNELLAFAKDALLQHPMFVELPALGLFITGGDFSPSAVEAVRRAHRFVPEKDGELSSLKPTELATLRRNAAYLIAVVMCELRARSVQEAVEVLFKGLWEDEARLLEDDESRLRALTEVEHLAGVGVACAQFQKSANEQLLRAQQAVNDSTRLRQEVEQLNERVRALESQLAEANNNLESERRASKERIEMLERTKDVQEVHLRDDNQQVRQRLVKRLVSDVEQLETGLSALRNPNPRIEVMLQRGERVVDALRAEIEKLREE